MRVILEPLRYVTASLSPKQPLGWNTSTKIVCSWHQSYGNSLHLITVVIHVAHHDGCLSYWSMNTAIERNPVFPSWWVCNNSQHVQYGYTLLRLIIWISIDNIYCDSYLRQYLQRRQEHFLRLAISWHRTYHVSFSLLVLQSCCYLHVLVRWRYLI